MVQPGWRGGGGGTNGRRTMRMMGERRGRNGEEFRSASWSLRHPWDCLKLVGKVRLGVKVLW